jgi:ribosome modulation factor
MPEVMKSDPIYRAGWKAKRKGYGRNWNPFDGAADHAARWLRGWREAAATMHGSVEFV